MFGEHRIHPLILVWFFFQFEPDSFSVNTNNVLSHLTVLISEQVICSAESKPRAIIFINCAYFILDRRQGD